MRKKVMKLVCNIPYNIGCNGDGKDMQGKKCAGKTDSGSESNLSGLWTFLVCRPDRQGTDSWCDERCRNWTGRCSWMSGVGELW